MATIYLCPYLSLIFVVWPTRLDENKGESELVIT